MEEPRQLAVGTPQAPEAEPEAEAQALSSSTPPTPPGTRLEQLRAQLLRIIDGDYASARLRYSLLPYLVAYAPLVATSVLAPPWLAVVMAIPSVLALYRVTLALDAAAFEVSKHRGLFAYALPLNLLLLLWSIALASNGRTSLVPTVAFAHVSLLYLAIAPACRLGRQRLARRVPLRWTFTPAAVVVLLLQAGAAFNGLGIAAG